jgi:predicted RNA-binding protein YlxR (DUF448 family)
MAKKGRRRKHIPQRTCVGCREVTGKRELLRLVRTADGVILDPSGKVDGRGAYIHGNQDCLRRALKGSLEQALRTKLNSQDLERMEITMQGLPAEREAEALVENE